MSECSFISWGMTAPASAVRWGVQIQETGYGAVSVYVTAAAYASLPLLLEQLAYRLTAGSAATKHYVAYLDPATGLVTIAQVEANLNFTLTFLSATEAQGTFGRYLGYIPDNGYSGATTYTAGHHPNYAWAPGRHFSDDSQLDDGASIVTQAWSGAITTDYLATTLNQRRVAFEHLTKAKTWQDGRGQYYDQYKAAQYFWTNCGRAGTQFYLHDNRQWHSGLVTAVGADYIDHADWSLTGDPHLQGMWIVFLTGRAKGCRRAIGSTAGTATRIYLTLPANAPVATDEFAVVLPDVAYKLDQETARSFTPQRMDTRAEFYRYEIGMLEVV